MGKHAIAVRLLLVSILAAAARAEGASFAQDQAHFEEAVRDASTAPYFVLVTIVDDNTKNSWTGCTTDDALESAIHVEHALGYDDASVARGREMMLAAKDHVFHFSNAKALEDIAMQAYAAGDLERARAYLRAHGTAFLLSSDWTKIDAANKLNRIALACAIIEKGLAARMADGTAETYAEP